MAEDYQQEVTGSMTYPEKGTLNRILFKSPLIWWRMGLGPILSHQALAGNKMLVMTSWGRKSQKPRHTMLSYVLAGEKVYVCSGWGKKSDWYKNLKANPQVTLQVGREIFTAKAKRINEIDEFKQIIDEMFETGGDTHFESWLQSFGIECNQQDILNKRDRLYLIGFDKVNEIGPPPLPVNLKWIWGVLVVFIIVIWVKAR